MIVASLLAHHQLLHKHAQLILIFNECGLTQPKLFEDVSLRIGGNIPNLFHAVGYNVHVFFHVLFPTRAVELLTSYINGSLLFLN